MLCMNDERWPVSKSSGLYECFPYECLSIHWIQWIMTKSKSGMVTQDALCLTIDMFPDEVWKKKFLLLHLDGYWFSVTHGNRHLPWGCKQNVLSISIAGNISAILVMPWKPYHFCTLPGYTEFAELGEIHLGKTRRIVPSFARLFSSTYCCMSKDK